MPGSRAATRCATGTTDSCSTADLRGEGAASRVLGVGHTLFDIALDEARHLSVSAAAVEGIRSPILIVSVEDEVTGTGSLVHRLIFGVTEVKGGLAPLRDWELLLVLNGLKFRSSGVEPAYDMTAPPLTATVDRLTTAFAAVLPKHAPGFRRPISWPEMLLVPTRSVPVVDAAPSTDHSDGPGRFPAGA